MVRVILVFLLTALVAAGGALLPSWIARYQDSGKAGGTQQMATVTLTIRSERTILHKLALMSEQNVRYPMTNLQTTLTEDQAAAAAYQALLPYVAAGLCPEIPQDELRCRAYLRHSAEDPGNYAIIWDCYPRNEGTVWLTVDDETGSLLEIQFIADRDSRFDPRDCGELVDTFARVYFAGLGVERYHSYGTDQLSRSFANYPGINDTVHIRAYDLPQEDGTIVHLEFVLHDSGFYTYFP